MGTDLGPRSLARVTRGTSPPLVLGYPWGEAAEQRADSSLPVEGPHLPTTLPVQRIPPGETVRHSLIRWHKNCQEMKTVLAKNTTPKLFLCRVIAQSGFNIKKSRKTLSLRQISMTVLVGALGSLGVTCSVLKNEFLWSYCKSITPKRHLLQALVKSNCPVAECVLTI